MELVLAAPCLKQRPNDKGHLRGADFSNSWKAAGVKVWCNLHYFDIKGNPLPASPEDHSKKVTLRELNSLNIPLPTSANNITQAFSLGALPIFK